MAKKKDTKGLAGIVKNVPRKIDINGQPHMLAWITANEGKALELLGGSGEAGPMGIPAYYDEGDDYGGPGGDQAASASGEQGSPDDPGFDGGDDRDDRVTSYEQARIDEAKANLEKSLAEHGGGTFANPMANSSMDPADFRVFDDYKARDPESGVTRGLAGLTRAQYNAMPNFMKKMYDKTGAYSFDIDEKTGKVKGFYGPNPLEEMGITSPVMSIVKSIFGKKPEEMTADDLVGVYTGYGRQSPFDDGKGADDKPTSGLTYLQTGEEEKVEPVSVSPADYYGKGIGSATIDMSDPLQRERFLMNLYGYTPSPIGATFDQPTSSYTIPGKSKKSRTRLRGLDIFKPVTM